MNFPNIINIQKYSVHDGDGIRTTIFFKGCAVRCGGATIRKARALPGTFMNAEHCTSCGAVCGMCPHTA